MNLAIDIGNTKTKIGLFKEDHLESTETFESLYELNNSLDSYQIDSAIISSVNISYQNVLKELKNLHNPIFLNTKTPQQLDH